jgi:hypothetical protein
MTRPRPRVLDWTTATSLADLGELTARYLSGEADASPTYGGPPNAETAEILEPLLALNHAGLVTHWSQPGVPTEGWQQRASVVGYCTPDLAIRLAESCRTAGLDTTVIAPSDRPRWRTSFARRVPVSLRNGEEFTWLGAVESTHALRRDWGWALAPTGLAALLDACEFTVHDPEWGRKDLLWDTLTREIH